MTLPKCQLDKLPIRKVPGFYAYMGAILIWPKSCIPTNTHKKNITSCFTKNIKNCFRF